MNATFGWDTDPELSELSLYLQIMDINRWNFFNFETLETHCNLIFNQIKSFLEY